jgi:hypothetical protein
MRPVASYAVDVLRATTVIEAEADCPTPPRWRCRTPRERIDASIPDGLTSETPAAAVRCGRQVLRGRSSDSRAVKREHVRPEATLSDSLRRVNAHQGQ